MSGLRGDRGLAEAPPVCDATTTASIGSPPAARQVLFYAEV